MLSNTYVGSSQGVLRRRYIDSGIGMSMDGFQRWRESAGREASEKVRSLARTNWVAEKVGRELRMGRHDGRVKSLREARWLWEMKRGLDHGRSWSLRPSCRQILSALVRVGTSLPQAACFHRDSLIDKPCL